MRLTGNKPFRQITNLLEKKKNAQLGISTNSTTLKHETLKISNLGPDGVLLKFKNALACLRFECARVGGRLMVRYGLGNRFVLFVKKNAAHLVNDLINYVFG